MSLVELYRQTSVKRHEDIQVSGDTVFVKGTDGGVDEYLVSGEARESWLVHSDREQKGDIKAIKNKLGVG